MELKRRIKNWDWSILLKLLSILFFTILFIIIYIASIIAVVELIRHSSLIVQIGQAIISTKYRWLLIQKQMITSAPELAFLLILIIPIVIMCTREIRHLLGGLIISFILAGWYAAFFNFKQVDFPLAFPLSLGIFIGCITNN